MKTTVYNDMKAMAIGGIYVFTWLLMALSVRAQCESRGKLIKSLLCSQHACNIGCAPVHSTVALVLCQLYSVLS